MAAVCINACSLLTIPCSRSVGPLEDQPVNGGCNLILSPRIKKFPNDPAVVRSAKVVAYPGKRKHGCCGSKNN